MVEKEELTPGDGLNTNQKKFCEEYFITGVRVTAYLSAYTECKYKSASANATRLLEDDRVTAYINFLEQKREAEITKVIERIRIMAFSMLDEADSDRKKLLEKVRVHMNRKKIGIYEMKAVIINRQESDKLLINAINQVYLALGVDMPEGEVKKKKT